MRKTLAAIAAITLSSIANGDIIRTLDFGPGEHYTKDYSFIYGDNAGFHSFDTYTTTEDVLEMWSIDAMTGEYIDIIATSGPPSFDQLIEGYIDPFPNSTGIALRMLNGSEWSATFLEPGPFPIFGSNPIVRDSSIAVLRAPADVSEPEHWAFFAIALAFLAVRRRFV